MDAIRLGDLNVGGTRSALALETALERHGDAVALVGADGAVSYRELAQRCDEVTDRLGAVRRLVTVRMSNDLESVTAYLGARRGGHVVMLLPAGRRGTSRDLWDSDAELHPTRGGIDVVEHREGTAHEFHEDLSLLLGTSGSTGSPKCVRLSGDNITSNALAIADYLGLTSRDSAITSLPLHYCYGLSILHSHLLVGAKVVLSELSVVDRCFWDVVSQHGVTSIAAVPHSLALIDRVGTERLNLPSLRRLTVAGGRTPPETVAHFAELGERWGWDLVIMYGQTEATARIAYLPPHLARQHPGSIGIAIPGGELELLHRDAGPPDVGELVYRGPNVMLGYASEPSDLARGPEVDALHTGDLARRGESGLFEIVGRANRIAKVFGERIDLDHLEDRLTDGGVPAWCVATATGIGVLTTDGDLSGVMSQVVEVTRLPRSAVQVGHVDELPRFPNGKPDRSDVRSRVRVVAAGVGRVAVPSAVRGLLESTLSVSEVRSEDTFVTLGGDSLSYVEVSLGLEELLDQLPSDWHVRKVGELEQLAARAGAPTRAHQGWRTVETNLVLRAVAIVLVVGSHAGMFRVRGGAHVLLAVAGFNFARFLLRPDRPTLRSDTVRSIARVALPASIWLAALSLLHTSYGWPSVALLNSYLGPPHWSAAWRYWFVEALVLALMAATLITSIPVIRRIDKRWPTAIPASLLVVALAARFDVLSIGVTPEPLLAPHRVVWFFVLGWFVARTRRAGSRLVASAVILIAVPGFFGEPMREAVVAVGLLALIWLPHIKLPARTVPTLGLVAGASLYIYLTHYEVYPTLLDRGAPPWVGVLASLALGITVWRACEPLVERLVGNVPRRAAPGFERWSTHLRRDATRARRPMSGRHATSAWPSWRSRR